MVSSFSICCFSLAIFSCSRSVLASAIVGLLRSARFQCRQIPLNAGFNLLPAAFDLIGGIVAVAVIDRLELAAINGDHGFGKQIELAAQQHKLAADFADRLAIVFTEMGNRFKVWR